MCGILGWHKRNSEFTDEEKSKFKNALDLIHSRGPDNTGFYFSPNTLLGHKRLKILDISDQSNQPYQRVNGKTLIYNGEVYNYKELSKKLEKETDFNNIEIISDTQIVYEILLRYKEYSINLFDGMFAFGWHDENDNSTLIARDPLGQKPLYYYHDKDETIYSSELTPITFLKKDLKLSKKNFAEFLKFAYYPGELTPFENIYKLLPGHYLIIKDGYLNKIRYWNNKPSRKISIENSLSEEKAIDKFLDKFLDSCEKTSIADVPVGIFLSGGIDSSLVYSAYKALGKDIQSFTVGFEDDEFDVIKNSPFWEY